MRMHSQLTMLAVLVVATHTWADGAKTLKGSKTQTAPKIDLGLPQFNAIPKADDLKKAGPAQDPQQKPSDAVVVEKASVLSVTHTRPGKGGPAPIASLTASGNPLTTDKFSSVVKVKSPGKRGMGIDVEILDPRGQQVMQANGSLNFHGSDETEWHVDWDSTSIRAAGDFQVKVTIGGDVSATFPLKVVSQ